MRTWALLVAFTCLCLVSVGLAGGPQRTLTASGGGGSNPTNSPTNNPSENTSPSSSSTTAATATATTTTTSPSTTTPGNGLPRAVQDSTIVEPSNFFYSHGGFMGTAPSMLADTRWVRILQLLMPDVYEELLKTPQPDAMIKACENNPVVAAYGFLHHNEAFPSRKPLALEWDLFIHPESTPEDPRVEEILIAHGSGLKHLSKEGKGQNMYQSVKTDLKPTEFGGVVLSVWRDTFTRALMMSRGSDPDMPSVVTATVDWAKFVQAFSQGLPAGTVPQVVLDLKTGFEGTGQASKEQEEGKAKGRCSPAMVRAIVKKLNEWGVHVIAAGSFKWTQIAVLSSVEQTVGGKKRDNLRPILFYHSLKSNSAARTFYAKQLLEEFQASTGPFVSGQTPSELYMMFNGGFLLSYFWSDVVASDAFKVTINDEYLKMLKALKTLLKSKSVNVHLGFYVQEYDINKNHLELLIGIANANADLFDLGFAWGGSHKFFYTKIAPSPNSARTGLSQQAAFGELQVFNTESIKTSMTQQFLSAYEGCRQLLASCKRTGTQVTRWIGTQLRGVITALSSASGSIRGAFTELNQDANDNISG